MNRLLQQTVKQTPEPDAVTKYTYFTSGALNTMQDPRLVALGTAYKYSYTYDSSGRKLSMTYPPADSNSSSASESWSYDSAGRPYTFTNRGGKMQTYFYETIGRPHCSSWNDSLTPSITLAYDIASRLTSINNDNANISRVYFDDGLLKSETEAPVSGGSSSTVTYSYNADGNRGSLLYPGSAYSFSYAYTGRDQMSSVSVTSPLSAVESDIYDVNGNLYTRTPANSTSSTYTVDALDRVTNISHALSGTTKTLAYGYDNVNRRTWAQRDSGNGDVFGYDLADAVTAAQLNIANPTTTSPGSQTIYYDANGNRASFATDAYATNNLNQYTSRTTGGNQTNATYDAKGNLWTFGTSTYLYDAQNRLTSATVNSANTTFKYDALNRQISRTTSANTTYSVWDGWNLLEEYQGSTVTAAYVYGVTGIAKDLLSNTYYYQDGSGSTSHLANSSGAVLASYRYNLQGTPLDGNGNVVTSDGYLFTGQRWMSGLGLYDLRTRFYSPDLGRFLQTDPIGFGAGDTNLYRYCGGNPVNRSDPMGTTSSQPNNAGRLPPSYQPNEATTDRVIVRGDPVTDPNGTGYFGMSGDGHDWGSYNDVTHYLGGGDHQGGPSGETGGGGSGIGHPFGSGVTEVTTGIAGVIVNFIYDPVTTLFWFGAGSPFGGLENSTFGGLILTGYGNNSLPSLGGGGFGGGPIGSREMTPNQFVAAVGRGLASQGLERFGNGVVYSTAYPAAAAVAAPVVVGLTADLGGAAVAGYRYAAPYVGQAYSAGSVFLATTPPGQFLVGVWYGYTFGKAGVEPPAPISPWMRWGEVVGGLIPGGP